MVPAWFLTRLPPENFLKNIPRPSSTISWDPWPAHISVKNRVWCYEFCLNNACYLCEYISTVTALAKYIWKLKRYKYEYSIKWRILARAKIYNPATKQCNLCNKEKYFIIFKPEISTLNQNNEQCAHHAKFIIGN